MALWPQSSIDINTSSALALNHCYYFCHSVIKNKSNSYRYSHALLNFISVSTRMLTTLLMENGWKKTHCLSAQSMAPVGPTATLSAKHSVRHFWLFFRFDLFTVVRWCDSVFEPFFADFINSFCFNSRPTKLNIFLCLASVCGARYVCENAICFCRWIGLFECVWWEWNDSRVFVLDRWEPIFIYFRYFTFSSIDLNKFAFCNRNFQSEMRRRGNIVHRAT